VRFCFLQEIQRLKVSRKIANLNKRVGVLSGRMEIEQGRVDALFKLYPHGIKKNGEPRKKPGRPRKVVV
jgi:hypothetical protein